MSKTNVRVDIPNSRPDELITLGKNIDKMNTELAAQSLAKGLNIAALQAGVATAKSKKKKLSHFFYLPPFFVLDSSLRFAALPMTESLS